MLIGNAGARVANTFLTGAGSGPQVGFQPYTQSSIPYPIASSSGSSPLAVDAAGNIFIAEPSASNGYNTTVAKLTPSASGYTQQTILSGFNDVEGIALDGAGDIFVADRPKFTVYEEVSNGAGGYTASTPFGVGTNYTYGPIDGVAVDTLGNVYVAVEGGGANVGVVKYSYNKGAYTASVVSDLPSYPGEAIAVDGNGTVYTVKGAPTPVSQTGSNYFVPAGGGSYNSYLLPTGQGVAVDLNGDVFLGQSQGTVLKETPTGVPPSYFGYSSSFASSIVATLPAVSVIVEAIDDSGNLYVNSGGLLYKLDYSDAPSLVFAPTAVGSTSADSPKTVTLQNAGNAPLTFPALSSGVNPSITTNFSLNSSSASACPLVGSTSSGATLAIGASCQLPVSYAPTAASPTTGVLTVTDNALNAPGPAYSSQQIALSVTASQTTPTITWAQPAAITYGTALSSTQLNATASVPGTFAYTPAAGTVVTAGTQTLSVTFSPTDNTDYASATATVQLTVNKATPAISWANPASIMYGTPLSATQLNATASVPGTFVYSPALGTVMPAGGQSISVTFTPTDSTDYASASVGVSFTVNKAPLSITANDTARVYGAANPSFTGAINGLVNGDSLTEMFSTTAVPLSIVGPYPIVPAVTGATSINYSVTATNGVLTVSQVGTGTTLALSNQNLTMTATVVALTSGSPTGTVNFYEGQTMVGSGTVTNGTATYTASSFPSGDVVISAQYGGDVDFTESSSPPLLVLTVSPATTSVNVTRGSSVSDNLNISVLPGYTGTLQFSCTGLPADSTCAFQPSSLAFTGASSTASVALTITTNTATGLLRQSAPLGAPGRIALATMLGLPGLCFIAVWRRKRRLSAQLWTLAAAMIFAVLGAGLIGCESTTQSSQQLTPTGTFNMQVVTNGASGLTQSTSINLTVGQ